MSILLMPITKSFPLATFCTALLGTALPSQAATFNVDAVQPHEHWQSMTLSLGDEQHYRAVETHSYSDATLSLNATQGVCDLPWLEMRVTLEQHQGASRAINLVPALLRVDGQPIVETMSEFITERGDDGFYAHFYLSDLATLMEEMREGEQIIIGFQQEDREPWYMTFSLQGADAAIERMLSQCLATNTDTGPQSTDEQSTD